MVRIIPQGTLTLMGSGEMTELLGKVHRRLLSRITAPVQAVFIDTPAGFQLNCDQLSAKAIEYFLKRFNVKIEIASLKRISPTDSLQLQTFFTRLHAANYIFAGPGSPSYAARIWRHNAVGVELRRRLVAGAQIVFASAAAATVGRYTLPVYEIYKVGEDPRWIRGLDLLGPQGIELAVVPHWNNQEGGTHDTRYCFMGEPRMLVLEQLLPLSAVILGIDEYTACTIDLANGLCEVSGAGGVTLRKNGAEMVFPSSSTFPTEYLHKNFDTDGLSVAVGPEPSFASPYVPEAALASSIEQNHSGIDGDLTAEVIQLLVDVRGRLRSNRQFALADDIRCNLSELGIELEDGREGTVWSKRELS